MFVMNAHLKQQASTRYMNAHLNNAHLNNAIALTGFESSSSNQRR
jgi:hypothetical protein